MGKSKNGGTRSFLRGRVGSDVYSIGKDAGGKKQQVVRSLAETVANPQTEAQMRGRMIMSTVMQAVSAMSVLIDHAFDSVPSGQPCISEFISRNYAAIKADVAAHPTSGNDFGLVKYGEKGAKQGTYVVADGKALMPAAIVNAATGAVITVSGESLTLGAVRSALGLGSGEFITLMGISASGALEFTRIHLSSALADTTVITSDNVSAALGLESFGTPTVTVNGLTIKIALANAQANSALIISKQVNGAYQHNKATLLAVTDPTYAADVALPTYPQGEQMILNGGNFNGGGSVTPVTPTYNPAIASVTANGQSVAKGAAKTTLSSGAKVSGTTEGLDPSVTYVVTLDVQRSGTSPAPPAGAEVDIVNNAFQIGPNEVGETGSFYLYLCSKADGNYTVIEKWSEFEWTE